MNLPPVLAAAITLFATMWWGIAGAQNASPAGAMTKSMEIRTLPGDVPVIDGRLDEAVWEQAMIVDDLHQISPREYEAPSESTQVRIFYDRQTLYVGARMSQSATIVANTLRQGRQFWGDDIFAVLIDTFNDKRNGYRFQINPNGLRMEAIYENATETNWNWNGIWRASATQDEQGWTAELAIPFNTLSFNPDNDTWGINFLRDISRGDEYIGWVSRNQSANPGTAGIAVGFGELQQGRGLDVVPSGVLRAHRSYDPAATETRVDPSLDIYYKITPYLNGSVTLNTDFSAAEVDDRQVEFTRFSLFFPEKRDFFLRDSDIFQFGRLGFLGRFGVGMNDTFSRPDMENGQPFFSRRIGLSQTGQPVDLKFGGKLAGRAGPWNVGALAIRQDRFEDVDATDIFVGRVAVNVLEESSAGIIVTHGDPRSNLDNSLVGLDFRYSNSRLPAGRVLETDLWYQRSRTEGLSGDDSAYGFRVRSPNVIGFRGSVGSKTIEDNFFPALGFVNRSGVRNHTLKFGYAHLFQGGPLRTGYAGLDAERIELLSGGLQTQVLTLRVFEFDTNQRLRGHAYLRTTDEVLARPFVVWRRGSERVVIPAGEYSFDGMDFQFSTSNTRQVWVGLNYSPGDFFGGTRKRSSVGVGWRPSRHLISTLSYQHNDVELPYGAFATQLVQFRTEVAFSSTLSWVTLLQYDDISESMGINARLHWIPEAGREGFLVLNHNLQDFDRDNRFDSVGTDLALKLNYTFRF